MALQRRSKIDQNISANDQIDTWKWRTLTQPMLSEDEHGAQFFRDFEHLVVPVEVALHQRARHLGERARGKDALSREGNGVAIQIGGENAYRHIETAFEETFGDRDRQRICLFPGGALRRPDAKLLVAVARLAQELGDDLLLQVFEELGITEKLGHVDEEAPGNLLPLLT